MVERHLRQAKSYPPEQHNHIGTEILIDTNEDGDYSDAPNLHDVLKEFRDQVNAMMDQLIFGGSFEASTGKFLRLSDRAISVGFADGEAIPATVTPDQDRLFFITTDNGTVHGMDFMDGDWLVAAGEKWIPINYGNLQIIDWSEIANIPDSIVYDDIAYNPDLVGKPLARYIDQSGNGKWIEGNSGGGEGGLPGYHEHGFDEIKDEDGNDLNDVIADLQGDIAALQGDLIFAGSYSGVQARVITASTQGQMNGFEDGAPLPDADAENKKFYVMVIDDGGDYDLNALSRGDWLISDGLEWIVLNYVQQDFDVPVLPGSATGRVLTWDNQSDMWTENTNFTLSNSGDIDMSGGIEAKGNITIAADQGHFAGDGSGLYNLPGMDDYEAPVTSVNSKTGDVTLNAADVGAAGKNHNHDGTYLKSETDPTVPSHVKGITTTNVSHWNQAWEDATAAFGWGDHSKAGYAKSTDIPTVNYPVTKVNGKTGNVTLNAGDVGAQPAGSYAAANHTHTEYQAKGDYAAANHNHSGVYAPASHTHNYAAANHTHSDYAAKNHSHSEYQPKGDYAAASHSHNYAPNSAGNGISISSGKIQMSGSYTGTFTATGDVTAYSDEALKKNVVTAPCDVIDQLRGVEFEWKEDGRFGSGLIAQEVEQVLPHLVYDDKEYKAVNYMGLVGYLIEEVKALKKEVEALRDSSK